MNLFWKRIPKTAAFEQKIIDNHALYHAVVKTEKSDLLAEYRELAEINFKQTKKQFRSKKAYRQSPMYEKELRINALKQDSDIKQFLHVEQSNAFDFIKHYKEIYLDDFSGHDLDKEQWINAYRWSYRHIKGNYSNINEFQAYTEGKNTEVIDGQVHIVTKRKEAEGRIWHKDKGFLKKSFKFTSDLITGESHLNRSGCVLIKFKLEGACKALQHFIRAYDDNNQRCITLLESLSPRKFRIGRSLKTKEGQDDFYSNVSGINLEKDFHILELEWNSEIMSWRINGRLIHQDFRMPEIRNMHLTIGSRLTKEAGGEGRIIVDYIRYYRDRTKEL